MLFGNYRTAAKYASKQFPSCTAGTTKASLDVALGRIEKHTPYRHTIRTIHTMDNDFAGVITDTTLKETVEAADVNIFTSTARTIAATEGDSFTWYTLQLRTQPMKIQRQSGTDPNNAIKFNVPWCDDVGTSGPSLGKHTGYGFDADYNGDWYGDYTDHLRPEICGTVEPAATYWVDVTVSQTMDVDLATPPSCPVQAAWGGGSAPNANKHTLTGATSAGLLVKNDAATPVDITGAHPRFPYNTNTNGGKPFNELDQRPGDMAAYLTTCGGWQHDATYRFTAANWNVPQYVYLYAHDDKDAAHGTSNHVANDRGGNELVDTGTTYYTTILKHYVETEDAVDNGIASDTKKVIQWNKHGGIYTSGNVNRFPFGVKRHVTVNQRTAGWGELDHTGFTTWGYSFYESLYRYGFYEYGGAQTGAAERPDSQFTSLNCGSVAMGGKWGASGSTNRQAHDGANSASSSAGAQGTSIWGTPLGDTNHQVGNRFGNTDGSTQTFTWLEQTLSVNDNLYGSDLTAAASSTPCTDTITGLTEPRPYVDTTGAFCSPVRVVSSANIWCAPRFASSFQANVKADHSSSGGTRGTAYNDGTGNAMRFPPADVSVRVTDNDVVADQTALAGGVGACRQTRLFQYADQSVSANRQKASSGVHSTEWLVDYNCKNGDAGGLPGYPANKYPIPGDAGIAGDDQCQSGTGPYCE